MISTHYYKNKESGGMMVREEDGPSDNMGKTFNVGKKRKLIRQNLQSKQYQNYKRLSEKSMTHMPTSNSYVDT